MERKVYFGNANKQLWITAPQSGLVASTNTYIAQNVLLSGRGLIKRSKASHRGFSATWLGSMNSEAIEDSLHTIKDFADGIYGSGPFYWLDPYAKETNLLPPHWASPMLSVDSDWPSITSIGTPYLMDTSDGTKNYPYKSLVTYSEGIAESSQSVRIIIPEGYKLHFGWHGDREGDSTTVVLRAYERSTGDTTDIITEPLSISSGVRTNKTVSGNTYSMVDIFIANVTGDPCAIAIAGMIAQVLPDSGYVEQGNFISGRGTTALEFSEMPEFEYYSANINNGQVGLSAAFTEV